MATEARWKGRLIASSDSTISVDGNAYFPAAALVENCFQASSHRSVCGWKGEAQYYPEPKEAAAEIKGRVAFWKGVKVSASE